MLRNWTAAACRAGRLAYISLLILALSGCEDKTRATASPSASAGEPVTPYQNIPPAWRSDGGDGTLAPGPLHLAPGAATLHSDNVLADTRPAEAFLAEHLAGSVRIAPAEWLGAPGEFKLSAARSQLRQLGHASRAKRLVVVGENDRQCAAGWVLLQRGGQPAPLILWLGMAGAKQAGWPAVRAQPETSEDMEGMLTEPEELPPAPAWWMESAEFDALTAGLSPVSGGVAVLEDAPLALTSPAETPPAGTSDTPASSDVPGATAPSVPPAAPGAPQQPAAPANLRFIYCGSQTEWNADARKDQLLRGLVRIPPGELYNETTGTLLPASVIQARVKILELEPATPCVLLGPDSDAICAVYMALTSAGFQHVRVYFR